MVAHLKDGAFTYNMSTISAAMFSRGGGVLPSKRLLGMCRWMGSHFHNLSDYNGVTFLVELLEWESQIFGIFWIRKFW